MPENVINFNLLSESCEIPGLNVLAVAEENVNDGMGIKVEWEGVDKENTITDCICLVEANTVVKSDGEKGFESDRDCICVCDFESDEDRNCEYVDSDNWEANTVVKNDGEKGSENDRDCICVCDFERDEDGNCECDDNDNWEYDSVDEVMIKSEKGSDERDSIVVICSVDMLDKDVGM